ncbi:MAG TPA: NADPH-dependent FMN reductase [Polyangiales bacterium]
MDAQPAGSSEPNATPAVIVITGSATRPSRTLGLASLVAARLAAAGFRVRELHVRDLPAEALLHARFDDPQLQAALAAVAEAQGVVFASPVYKAAYSGLLKTFIDLLPQFGLRGKTVLPLLTGGTLAHVLALDYALRPVLQSLDPRLVVSGLFVLDKLIELQEGQVTLAEELVPRMEQVVQTFGEALLCR